MVKIGLTGGICTGKTFVLEVLKELGCYTVRADDIARSIIFSPNSPVAQEILKHFGEGVLDRDGTIDKGLFTRILFDDAEKRQLVNQIVHPLVAAEREKMIRDLENVEVYRFFIYESALLVESGVYREFDKIIVVYTTPEQQVERLVARDGIDPADAKKRLKSQFPLSEKLKVANYTIDTSGRFENARANTLEVFHLIEKDFPEE